ncbi:MAG TPA: type II toxin-antitoxin system CcdA family antitoxin [Steroidobacteraceae bacterium]|jgi:post-segregation antitoxin (ccd killing protein)|nr:type II toxin-antitoxin system CcdA family antitoxin [Steroidobacteraceae bacterium]
MPTARRNKQAVNVSISTDLLRVARNSGINLSATLEAAVEHELRSNARNCANAACVNSSAILAIAGASMLAVASNMSRL